MADKRVCPVERSGSLESVFRKAIHNPRRLLGRYIKPGMTVLDVGCGPGMFSIELARMVGPNGKVIAADLQEGMLDKLKKRIEGTELADRIVLHKTKKDAVAHQGEVDFVLAFYVVHEVPDDSRFLDEMKSIMKKNSILFIVEPRFHVNKDEFSDLVELATEKGFRIRKYPKVFLSRSVVLQS